MPETIVEPQNADPPRPNVVRSVPTLGDISLSPKVVSTNFALALFTLLILILTAAVINQTLEENERFIHNFLASVFAPIGAVFNFLTGGVTSGAGAGTSFLRSFIPTIAMLGLAAAIYGLEEPGTGFNNRSLVLFLSYLGAFAVVTYAYDGTQFLLSRRYGVQSVVRVFPIGVVVALGAVVLTRVTGFEPGLMYGFVAANAIATPQLLTREQEGKQTFYPALVLLTACVLAWVLAGPARSFAEDNDEWWAAVPEGVAVGLFVSGLQSLFFQMVPIQFMDGAKLLRWNKFAWLGLSLVSGFLFWEALLNDDKDSVNAIEQTKSVVALIVIVSCLAVTIVIWALFRALNRERYSTAD